MSATRKLFYETPLSADEKLALLNSTIAAENDAAEKKAANDKFIKAFKKSSGQKTQTVLPSATTANNEWAVREGWSICDAMHWRSLCERAKHAQDDVEGDSFLELLMGTIEVAARCDSHPIGLIAYARTAFGAKTWDIDTLHMMMDNILEETDTVDVDKDDDEGSGSGKKRKFATQKYDASQPYPTDAEIDEINAANLAAGDVNF